MPPVRLLRLAVLALVCAAVFASALPAAADPLAGATPTATAIATATSTGTGRARATATRAATATRTPTPSPTGMATAAAPRSTATAPAPTATLVSVAVVAQTELPPATEEITVTRGGQSITRHVLKTVRTSDGREAAAGRVVVRFRDGTDDSTRTRIHAESATRATGGSPAAGRTTRAAATDSSLQRQVVELPGGADLDSAVLAYRSDSRVLFAEPDYVFRAHETPNDPFFATQWGLEKIGAATAWNVTHGGAATIAILDCGIFDETSAYLPPGGDGLAGHPDIRGKVTARHNLSGMPDADDFCNHGTHVAGIAAAATNNGVGGSGVGFDARLLNVKVLDDGGSGSNLSVAQGITWAAANGAKVINMSLGAPGACPTTLQSAIDAAWSRGVVIVAAAGNDAASGADSPGNCNNVLAVASTTTSDGRSSFSNYGPGVDVAAPGSGIYSTDYIGRYVNKSGTSMAAPHVAGLAALIWTLPGVTTPQQVVDRITANADAISGTGSLWQHGRINAARAVGALTSTSTPTRTPTVTSTASGGSTSTPTSTATRTSTATVTATLDPKPSVTPTPTFTAVPTSTSVPTSTPVPTSIPAAVDIAPAPPASGGGGGPSAGGGSSGGSSSSGGGSAAISAPSAGGSSASGASSSAGAAPALASAIPSSGSIVQTLPTGQISILAPGAAAPVVVQTGAVPRVPDQWCPADHGHQQHIRLDDVGIAGATFGVLERATLEWIPPEHAGCVDWSRMDKSVSFTKEVIMQFTLSRPQPGALLWVLDGPAEWNGRLYEVGEDGISRYVTGAYFEVHQAHFRETWKNVMPISAAQAQSFAARNLIGPDLR